MIDAIDRWENEGGAAKSKRPLELTHEKVANPSQQPGAGRGFETAAKASTSAGEVPGQAQDSTRQELAWAATDKPGARSI